MSLFWRSSLLAVQVVLAGCGLITPDAPEENTLLDGPIAGLSAAQLGAFTRGDAEFSRRFTAAQGLGPVFNASSCDACHPGDGRAHPELGFVRFGRVLSDGSFDPMHAAGGPQLQDRAIAGHAPEALPPGVAVARLLAPAVTGLGLLEAVDDATLLALEDPDDLDGDGISGRAHRVAATPTLERIAALGDAGAGARLQLRDGAYLGRFGRKAGNISLLHQTLSAYNQDMGLTSSFAPDDPGIGLDLAPTYEISDDTLRTVARYLELLRPPARRDADHPVVLAGEALFAQIGCASCHVPALPTGVASIAPLHDTVARAYTDLLLHDMGAELDDGVAEGDARSAEWRTAPLWGLGLSANAQGGQAYYMHDGRARTLSAAIALHGGEASASRQRFNALSAAQQAQLITFLESL
jgi:CxxC motif-containing protein (DUF1111 family)